MICYQCDNPMFEQSRLTGIVNFYCYKCDITRKRTKGRIDNPTVIRKISYKRKKNKRKSKI